MKLTWDMETLLPYYWEGYGSGEQPIARNISGQNHAHE